MAAGDRDHRARRIDARAGDEPFVDRLLESESRPAQIADGGEAAHQGVGGLGGGDESGVADIVRHRGSGVRAHQHRVPMRVDQAGHQRAAAAVDRRWWRRGAAIGAVEIRSILLPLTSTFEGADSVLRSCRRRCGHW